MLSNMSEIAIYVIVLSIFPITFVIADYQCLCNYNVEKTVYASPSSGSQVIGYLYEFDCKPVYGKIPKDSKFQPVHYEKQVGYVEVGNNIQIQVCRGIIPTEDLVKATAATTTTLPTTQFMSTTTPQPTRTYLTTLLATTDHNVTHFMTTTSNQNVTTSSLNSTTVLSTDITLPNIVNTNATVNSSSQTNYTTSSQLNISGNPITLGVSPSTVTLPSTTTGSVPSTSPVTTLSTSTPSTPPTTTSASVPPTTPSTTTPTTKTTTTLKSSTTTQTTTTTTPAPKPSCPNGWMMHGTSCYLFHTNNRRHWSDANNDCASRKSHLAIIETAEEFNFLKQQLDQRIDTHDDDDSDTSAWVAGSDSNNEGSWEWYDAFTNTYKPFTYTHWGHNEPDAGGHDHEEDCMTMVGNKGFKWADYHCNENMFYVCEQSALHVNPVTQVPVQTQSPAKQTTASCPSGWVMDHGSCYYFHTNGRSTWSHATSDCKNKQSHLVIIETAGEFSFLKQQLNHKIDTDGHDGSHTSAWVAGTDRNNEGRWEWYDGFANTYKPFTYTHWGDGEPDAGEGKHEEDCVTMVGNHDFEWEDYHCDEDMYYVCEQSALHVNPVTQVPVQTQNPSKLTNTNCPSGWIMDRGSCYFFYTNDRSTWSRANSFCSANQAHLAIIETAEEDHFIAQQSSQRINVHDDRDANTGIWVAGTDDDTEGRWEWADGASYRPIQGYNNWHKGEPDAGDGDHDEDCMCLIGNKGFDWEDYRCDEHMYFVCEKPVSRIAPLVG